MIHSNATSKPQEVVIRAKNIVNSFRVGTLQGRTNDSIKPINPSNSICKMFFFSRDVEFVEAIVVQKGVQFAKDIGLVEL